MVPDFFEPFNSFCITLSIVLFVTEVSNFGFLNLLWAKKFNKDVTLYLIGIDPNYQKLGVTAIIFNSFIQTLKGKGIQICRRTPELTDNISIDKIWKNFNPKLIKTRSTYKLNLN